MKVFNLPAFMLANFNGVDFGGNLFGQWPVGIRFDVGHLRVARAVNLFQFLFQSEKDCIIISQDWPATVQLQREATPLFETPGIFSEMPLKFETIDITHYGETPYRLTWTGVSTGLINAAQLFQAIANREQDGHPKIISNVCLIDPAAKIIMHMYDDRGLDVIATNIEAVRPLYEAFRHLVLDNQKHRVDFRFQQKPQED